MMRVVVWATHLQTDILALCAHLDRCPDVALLIVTDQAATYLAEPVARLMPLKAPVIDRNDPATMARVRAFGGDVVVADNHLPPPGVAPQLFYMWHGMGWKARSRLDIEVFRQQVRRLTGQDPRRPATRFRAQCYGPTDFAWRVDNWGLAAENCVVTGMCFSDILRDPPWGKREIADAYAIDVVARPTVLLSITWHYGGVFARDGTETGAGAMARDMAFIRAIGEDVRARGANLLLCLHDRKRYDPAFLAAMEQFADESPFVDIRFKNEHPDNLADLLVADVMVSNLSSFLAYHYVLRRPAVHILPVQPHARRLERIVMLFSRFRIRSRLRQDEAWMLDPTDIGGVLAPDEATAIAAIRAALDNPDIGRAPTGEWLGRHLLPIDGQACARVKDALVALCREA